MERKKKVAEEAKFLNLPTKVSSSVVHPSMRRKWTSVTLKLINSIE